MAATFSLCLSLEPNHHSSTFPLKSHHTPVFPPKVSSPPPFSPKSPPSRLTLSSTSQSSSSSSTSSSSTLQDPFKTGRFLTTEELRKLQFLESFYYHEQLSSGSLWIRVMKPEEMDMVVALLSESFAESMLLPSGYVTVLGFLVKQYMIERRSFMPHTATLIGFYKENGEENLVLGGSVEVSFDRRGANASPPTPTPPKDSPYVCNMSVKKPLRRRGIGWHLLKASEQLVSQMCSSREVYLHCRMIDTAPLNMYAKAGYSIVKTDSMLILLTLQRRKHLMRKELQVLDNPLNISDICEGSF